MPTYPIPHNAPSINNPTPTTDPKFMGPKRNLYVDIDGRVVNRPGVKATVSTGAGTGHIQGMAHRWQGTTEFIVCTRDGTSCTFDTIGITGTPSLVVNDTLGVGITLGGIGGAQRPSFITFGAGSFMFISVPNGDKVLSYAGPSTEVGYAMSHAQLDPAWNPTKVGYSVFLNNAIVASEFSSANTQTEVLRFSNVGLPFNWSSGDFFTAEGAGDFVRSIAATRGSLLIFGPQSIEIREFDGTSYPLVPGGVLKIGTVGADAFAQVDEDIYFIDFYKRLFVFNGRDAQQLPFPYQPHLEKNISVGVGGGIQLYPFYYKGKNYIYIVDRASGNNKAMVYDTTTGDSYEWDYGTTSSTGLNLSCVMSFPFLLNDTLLAGAANTNKVCLLSEDSHSGHQGSESIRKSLTTGWINHGTNKQKKSTELRIYVDRLETGGVYPTLTVRYRNNGSSSYAATRTINISAANYQYSCYRLKALGYYRERQYEIFTDSSAPLRIGRIEEDVTYL